ncbi:MAG: hypothetical protein GY803_17205 [Chloroflexi bacterium]|nr:hypothetical protein [Chloroflexota bacterium]
MSAFVILKLLVVIIALIVFLRRPGLARGVGLLSVTTAVLLDTFLGAFGREELLAELGFFFYIIGGALLAGATFWVWGLLWEWGLLPPVAETTPAAAVQPPTPVETKISPNRGAAFDRKMLYDEIRGRFGREDVLDLMFDLGINETDVVALDQDLNHLIVNVMDKAEENGQTGGLALAVERILTPPPPENLPRLEKIDADSPATILRHYLLAHYDLTQLQEIASALNIDWERLTDGSKQNKVRSLLLYLYRRNQVDELIDYLRQGAGVG